MQICSPFTVWLIGTAAAGNETRGRQLLNDPYEEHKGGYSRSDSQEDTSLTREKTKSKGMKAYTVPDGEFSSFPEIP